MSHAEQLDTFKTLCRKKGLKMTHQRLAIYEELLNSGDHPSAETLYTRLRHQLPTITLDTVYRALNTFAEMGVASIVEGTGNSKRFEGNMDVHHHARCTRCGKIIDVYNHNYDRLAIPPELEQEFDAFKTTVHIIGVCRACQQAKAEVTGSSAER